MVEMQFEINVSSFFRKVPIASDVFRVMGFSPDPRRSDRESTFAQDKLSFRKNKLF